MSLSKRKLKIIATIGPACGNSATLEKMIAEGVNCFRFNFSHGDYKTYLYQINLLKKIAQEKKQIISFLADLRGPRLRIGEIKNDGFKIKKGTIYTFSSLSEKKLKAEIPIDYQNFHRIVKKGDIFLIDDGLIEIKVKEVKNKIVFGLALNEGIIKSHKGINIPDISLNIPSLTEKDLQDLDFAIKNNFDFVALSFVQEASDIENLKKILARKKAKIKVIAKIEKKEAIHNFEKILKVSDGIMIARGDLGVEAGVEFVPVIQKMLLEKCRLSAKTAITATQMLESMIQSPKPTRAEAADVANAVLDGTDAVLLSAETAVGKYPIEAIKVVSSIAFETEKFITLKKMLSENIPRKPSIPEAIGESAKRLAEELKAKAIIVGTKTGATARLIAKYRPGVPVIAAVPNQAVARHLTLVWSVFPVIVKSSDSTDTIIKESIEAALSTSLVKKRDLAVIVFGLIPGLIGGTNSIKVVKI